jgi:hypothetical protein
LQAGGRPHVRAGLHGRRQHLTAQRAPEHEPNGVERMRMTPRAESAAQNSNMRPALAERTWMV